MVVYSGEAKKRKKSKGKRILTRFQRPAFLFTKRDPMASPLFVAQEEEQFESLIQGLIEQGFGQCDPFLEASVIAGLRGQLLLHKEAGTMHSARIGRKFDLQKNTLIRGDVIQWMDRGSTHPLERMFLDKIDRFIAYLNRTCYTAITDYEFHYAYYERNSFYKRHLDQFRSDRGRKFSLVLYLNDNWQTSDGGQLSIYLPGNEERKIEPVGGRLVFFRSDQIEHEVKPSFSRFRLSLAGWLKSL
jgi:SM-20-related protein